MKLKPNREYVLRHLFVTVVMLALSAWFGFDALARYPETPARDLYVSIESSQPPDGFDLESFKKQKIETQYGFAFITFLVAAVVGVRLWNSCRFRFEYDGEGFSVDGGEKHRYGDVKKLDGRKWKKLGILRFSVEEGGALRRITLDSWHHEGVKEVAAHLGV